MKGIALIVALLYMIMLGWISLTCDEEYERELQSITLFLAGLVPLLMCLIMAM